MSILSLDFKKVLKDDKKTTAYYEAIWSCQDGRKSRTGANLGIVRKTTISAPDLGDVECWRFTPNGEKCNIRAFVRRKAGEVKRDLAGMIFVMAMTGVTSEDTAEKMLQAAPAPIKTERPRGNVDGLGLAGPL